MNNYKKTGIVIIFVCVLALCWFLGVGVWYYALLARLNQLNPDLEFVGDFRYILGGAEAKTQVFFHKTNLLELQHNIMFGPRIINNKKIAALKIFTRMHWSSNNEELPEFLTVYGFSGRGTTKVLLAESKELEVNNIILLKNLQTHIVHNLWFVPEKTVTTIEQMKGKYKSLSFRLLNLEHVFNSNTKGMHDHKVFFQEGIMLQRAEAGAVMKELVIKGGNINNSRHNVKLSISSVSQKDMVLAKNIKMNIGGTLLDFGSLFREKQIKEEFNKLIEAISSVSLQLEMPSGEVYARVIRCAAQKEPSKQKAKRSQPCLAVFFKVDKTVLEGVFEQEMINQQIASRAYNLYYNNSLMPKPKFFSVKQKRPSVNKEIEQLLQANILTQDREKYYLQFQVRDKQVFINGKRIAYSLL